MSKAPSQAQRKHAIDRINDIKHGAIRKIEEDASTTVTVRDIKKLLEAGKVKVKGSLSNEVSRYSNVEDIFDIPVSANARMEPLKFPKASAQVEKLIEDARVAVDIIMLSDQDEILKTLMNFAKKHGG